MRVSPDIRVKFVSEGGLRGKHTRSRSSLWTSRQNHFGSCLLMEDFDDNTVAGSATGNEYVERPNEDLQVSFKVHQ
jgi:hypothetical protein